MRIVLSIHGDALGRLDYAAPTSNPALQLRQQPDVQVALEPLPRLGGHAGTETARTAVGGAGVAADEVRPQLSARSRLLL